MIGALGGHAAERLVLGVVSTGAESDLQLCTAIARSMVGRWGMSERIGPVSVFPPEGDPRLLGVSERSLDAVAAEVRRLVDECHREAMSLLTQHRARLDGIAQRLLEHETLDEAAVYAAAGLQPGTEPARQAPDPTRTGAPPATVQA
jgi:cell division protease FtsH